jgi:hypothetical protein
LPLDEVLRLAGEIRRLLRRTLSKNPRTRVGDCRVTAKLELADGDHIELGSVSIIYRCSTAGLSTEAIPIQNRAVRPPGRH